MNVRGGGGRRTFVWVKMNTCVATISLENYTHVYLEVAWCDKCMTDNASRTPGFAAHSNDGVQVRRDLLCRLCDPEHRFAGANMHVRAQTPV